MSISLPIHNFKIFAEKPVLNQLRPVQIKDWFKTVVFGFFLVQSGLFQFQDKGRLVSVLVPEFWDKKPDQTRPPSTSGEHQGPDHGGE